MTSVSLTVIRGKNKARNPASEIQGGEKDQGTPQKNPKGCQKRLNLRSQE
jgi:hypothetical protein